MGFSDPKEINRNTTLLYKMGDILMCPVCRVEYYRVLRDIYQGDRTTRGQVEDLTDDIKHLRDFGPTQYCVKCYGGGKVLLVAMTPGLVADAH